MYEEALKDQENNLRDSANRSRSVGQVLRDASLLVGLLQHDLARGESCCNAAADHGVHHARVRGFVQGSLLYPYPEAPVLW